MSEVMHVQTCVFRRKQGDRLEYGIMINCDAIVIDQNSKPVKFPMWDYRLVDDLVVTVHIPENITDKGIS